MSTTRPRLFRVPGLVLPAAVLVTAGTLSALPLFGPTVAREGKPKPETAVKKPAPAPAPARSGGWFAKRPAAATGSAAKASRTYPLSEVKVQERILKEWNGSNSRLVIDVGGQRAYLLVNEKVAVSTPVSTARSGKSTPRGTFTMTERVRSGKISNLYHVGMPYWMRLGETPYGAHSGYLPGYPASAGCVRLPHTVAEVIFNHTRAGTPVSIHSSWRKP
jgi:lipoprotein-anchoring transpeptidase ErfK/SrfK